MATQITAPLLQILRMEMNAALKAIAEKHGVEIAAGRASFSAELATFKLEVRTIGSDGISVTKELHDLRRYAPMIGLTADHLTQVFKLGNENYTLSGYRSKASAKPFLIKRVSDDKVFIADETSVLRALGVTTGGMDRGAPRY